MIRVASLLVLIVLCAVAQDPIVPHSAFEPPAAAPAAALTASKDASPKVLLTTGERSNGNETAPYSEAVEISHRLEGASRFVRKQFRAKLADEPSFAANARERLAWWYVQSKYQPTDSGRYPVVRVWQQLPWEKQ